MEYHELGSEYFPNRVWGNCLTIGLSSFYWGYYLAVLATPIDNISHTLGWGADKDVFTAVFSALFPLGAALGSVVAGSLANARGRRKTLVLAAIYGIVSSIVHGIPFTATFAIGRFSCGLAGGVMAAVPSLYIYEISPTSISGKTGTVVQLMLSIGIFVATTLGLALPVDPDNSLMNNWWIFMVVFPAFVMALQLILLACIYKHEPASWLISQGRTEEASKSANFYYNSQDARAYIVKLTGETKQVKLISDTDPLEDSIKEPEVTYGQLLCFEGKYKKMMIIGVFLFFLAQFCGINAIANYSGFIFGEFADVFMGRVYAAGYSLWSLVTSISGTPFIDRSGRRPLMIVGCSGMMCCHLALALLSFLDGPPELSVSLIFLWAVFFQLSAGPVVWVICGDIMNAKGMSIVVCVNWLCAAIVEVTFPFLIIPGIYVAFLLYGSVCFSGLLFSVFVLKETKGLSKEEIKKKVLNMTECRGYS